MIDASTARQQLDRVGSLFGIDPVGRRGEHLRIRTPSQFPGGERVDLFLLTQTGQQKLSDLRNTLDFLGTLADGDPTISPQVIGELRSLFAGVEYDRGEFFVLLREGDDLARAVDSLRCAMLAAAYHGWKALTVGGQARHALALLRELQTGLMLDRMAEAPTVGEAEGLFTRGGSARALPSTIPLQPRVTDGLITDVGGAIAALEVLLALLYGPPAGGAGAACAS